MLAALTALLALSGTHVPAACAYDRARMLGLEQRAFDQDMQGGWRAVAHRRGCEIAAADLIRDYRRARGSEDRILLWHEGQLRAQAGQTGPALKLFGRSYEPGADPNGWNAYVDATLAFLRRDRPGLLAARARLLQLPKPADYPAHARAPDGSLIVMRWPPNLNVVDGLIACFGRPYAEAYGSPCTASLYTTKVQAK